MILRFLSAAALLAASPALAQSRPQASPTVTPVATGSYLIGNPKARVRLVEYVSYTCPHCAHYAEQSEAAVKAMIRSGSLAVEVRNQVHDGFDLAAATLARCAGPAAFPALHAALFARQREWIERAVAWQQANAERIRSYPQLAQLKALVDGSGLADIARASGVPQPRIDACFANERFVAKTLAVSNATKVSGTPAFEINGRLVENVDWAKLQPMLRAAGAK